MAQNNRIKRLNNFYCEREKREVEEHLEILWHIQEKHGSNMIDFLPVVINDWNPAIMEALKNKGYVNLTQTEFKFTEKGNDQARQVVRSHRIAERLLTDILDLKIDQAESGACEFEHIVVPEIVDGICTLLGHPKVCPHGLPIPEGQCCREARKTTQTIAKNMFELKTGQEARIAYVNTQSNSRMHQLTQLGISPGTEIKIHQTYPVFVIKINTKQIAIDETVARDVIVWI